MARAASATTGSRPTLTTACRSTPTTKESKGAATAPFRSPHWGGARAKPALEPAAPALERRSLRRASRLRHVGVPGDPEPQAKLDRARDPHARARGDPEVARAVGRLDRESPRGKVGAVVGECHAEGAREVAGPARRARPDRKSV